VIEVKDALHLCDVGLMLLAIVQHVQLYQSELKVQVIVLEHLHVIKVREELEQTKRKSCY
jgi:hypothetical protein